MTTAIALFILLHFVVVGILIERKPRFFTTRVLAYVFTYFFVVYAAFGYVLRAAPWLVDPRQ
jgi:hypothetical protein